MALDREYFFVIVIVLFCQCVINAAWQWELVFEAFSYGPPNAHALFTGNDATADRSSLSDKQHFKHPVVNEWNSINKSRVTIEIIKNKVTVAYVTFNGHQSDRKSWMSIENILESSYSDVTYSSLKQHVGRTGFHFSVDGTSLGILGGHRRFYINKLFNGCDGDDGWILLLEGMPACSFEQGNKTPYNYTLVGYVGSTTSSIMKYNSEFDDLPNNAMITVPEGRWEHFIGAIFADSLRIMLEYEPTETKTKTTNAEVKTTVKAVDTVTKSDITTTVDTTITIDTTTKSMTADSTTKSMTEDITTKAMTEDITTKAMTEDITTTADTTTKAPNADTTTKAMPADITTTETQTELSTTESMIASKTSTTVAEMTTFVPGITNAPPSQGSKCTMCTTCDVIDTNLSISELRDMIKQLQEKLTVDKTKLSKTIGQLNSAQDPRLSSMAMGVVFGGTIFGSVFAALILPDMINLIRLFFRLLQSMHDNNAS